MPIRPEDRPLATVQEEAVDILIYNYSYGHITNEAFERRLDVVMDSQNQAEILEQISDLSAPADSRIEEKKREALGIQYDHSRHVDEKNIINIFAGSDTAGVWHVPKVIRTVSIFGGTKIDFSDAVFTTQQVTIKALCLFGGNDIVVPPGVRVSTSSVCIFAGVNNKADATHDTNGPELQIEGFFMFAGLNIQIKRTVKEKFRDFAQQMKTLFGQQ